MSAALKLYITPVISALCFFGGVFAALSMVSSDAETLVTIPIVETEPELITTQMSFPVYADQARLGHCVLALRIENLDEESPEDQIKFNTINKALYEVAAIGLAQTDDGSQACADFKKTAQKDFTILSASFMREDAISQ